jgi:transposase
MSKAVEVITSVERRRRWSSAEKERLVAASLEAGGSVSAVARSAGIHPSQLYGWRRQLVRGSQPAGGFAAVRIGSEPIGAAVPADPMAAGLIEIEFANGSRMRVTGADPAAVSAAIVALASGGRRR